jgi:hypothetical protein
VLSHKNELEMDNKGAEHSLTIIKSDFYESEELVSLATHRYDQLSVGQMSIEISKGSPQFSDLQIKERCSYHEKQDFMEPSNLQLEHQEDSLSPYVYFVSNFDGNTDNDEEEGYIFPNLFQDHIVDNSMQESSSLLLGFDPDIPIFNKYSDEEEDFKVYKGLLTNEISSSSTLHQRVDKKCMRVMTDDSCESVFQNSNEDLCSFDISAKEVIIGKSSQQFLHDTSFKTHFSFDHYQDNDVEDEEHISSSLLKIFSCNGPTRHRDKLES